MRRNWIHLLLVAGLLAVLAGCAGMTTSGTEEARQDVLYSCACGPECTCGSVSTKPGNCTCGKPMKWGHVVWVEGDEAILCQCAEGCSCQGLNPTDPAKCACGKPVKRVSLKGTGIYFCNCGGACGCNTVSDQPGPCKCGMELKQSN